jgi:hypothetical protein
MYDDDNKADQGNGGWIIRIHYHWPGLEVCGESMYQIVPTILLAWSGSICHVFCSLQNGTVRE